MAEAKKARAKVTRGGPRSARKAALAAQADVTVDQMAIALPAPEPVVQASAQPAETSSPLPLPKVRDRNFLPLGLFSGEFSGSPGFLPGPQEREFQAPK